MLLFFLFLSGVHTNYADDFLNQHNPTERTPAFPYYFDSSSAEVHKIIFQGNQSFSETELLRVITNRPSESSIIRDIFQMYYLNGIKKKFTPKTITKILRKNIKSLEYELHFFEKATVDADVESISNYYNQNGWHFARVDYHFYGDKDSKENILAFHVTENKRYTLSSINYTGLELIDSSLIEGVNKLKTVKVGSFFNEYLILDEISRINDFLQNNGYYFCHPTLPDVLMDTTNFTDSISIKFDLGNRFKIGNIVYKDYLNGQNAIAFRFKQKFVDIKEGDWFSRQKINQTQRNLVNLNLFESVVIDTADIDYFTGEPKIGSNQTGDTQNGHTYSLENDSIISFRIKTFYSKQQEWGLSPFLNKTAFDELVNLGLEGEFTHKNWFGAAQNFNLFANVSVKDINRSINDWLLSELIYQVGFKYTQPLLWTLNRSKVAFSVSPSFARRTINNLININSVTFPVRFPVTLPSQTYFNQILIDFDFERQNPEAFNFDTTLNNQNAQLRQFLNLKAYTDTKKGFNLTSNILGITLLGDRRNNPFEPTQGYYTNLSVDGWNFILGHSVFEGLSKYYRFQLAHYQFFKTSETAVLALKGRFGATYTFNFDNNYIPLEKQFFAGGANSVRGWDSRRLRYTSVAANDVGGINNYNILQDFAGSKTIIEGSIEYRYKFKRPAIKNDFLADMIAKCGFTFFFDFGNTFGWYLGEEKTQIKYYEYITKLAVAMGAGFRFDTPVGPFRIDLALPIQGPIEGKPDFIFNRKNPLSDFKLHLGLGHSF